VDFHIADGSVTRLNEIHIPAESNIPTNKLLLFIARRGLRLERYRDGPQYSSYNHCIEKLNSSSCLEKHNVIALCCSLLTAIRRNRMHHILGLLEDIENQDDDVEPSSSEDESDNDSGIGLRGIRNDHSVSTLENLRALSANICRCGNIDANDPVVELFEGKKETTKMLHHQLDPLKIYT